MKLSQFKQIVREEVRKAIITKTRRVENRTTLNEAVSEQAVLDMLYKEVARVIKSEGIKKPISPADIKTIGLAWLRETLKAGLMDDTLGEDIYENSTINKIIKKYDPDF
jgi:hypothetical protein